MKARMSLYAALACISAAYGQQIANQKAVDNVANGTEKTARVSWWGFDKEDSTQALKAAIGSKAPKVIVDKMASSWITADTLEIPSNKEIVFEEGAVLEAKRGSFIPQGACLVQVLYSKNVVLRGEGKGATLKMHKMDYHKPPYEKSEWRHCISLLSCRDVTIQNLTLLESGGDGIYFGIRDINRQPTNIIVRDVVCDGNNRQGISVIAGIDCLIENTKLINTWGTPPAAGIDFEPNRPGEITRNFVLRNCESYNNQGAGYELCIYFVNSTSSPVGITLENCTSHNEGTNPFNIYAASGPGNDLEGYVNVKNCTFSDCPAPVTFKGAAAHSFRTQFENVTIKNVSQKDEKINPILIGFTPKSEDAAGNLHFKNVKVYDNKERELITFQDGGPVGGLKNVSGKIEHFINGKKQPTLTLTDEWAQKNYPSRTIPLVDPYDMTNAQFEAAMPGAALPTTEFGDVFIRGRGTYYLVAKAGDTLAFTLDYQSLTQKAVGTADLTLIYPSGKRQKLESIEWSRKGSYELKNLAESGLYKLSVEAARAGIFALRSCTLPCGALTFPQPLALGGGQADSYFYVPAGTREFTIMFQGEGQEGLKATILAPDGTQLWEQDDISQKTYFHGKGDAVNKGGVFTLRIRRPTHLATIEDHQVRIMGIPPFLSPCKELTLKPIAK